MNEELMKKKLLEGRQYRAMQVLKPDDEEERLIVQGYATTFNQRYTLYADEEIQIDEQVDSRAFEGCDMSDVILQYNHEGRVFARTSNGTLALAEDEHGLLVRADLSGTTIGRELYEEIKGGYTTKMSFGFIVTEDDTDQIESVDGKRIYVRTIKKIGKLFDVSAVSIPANDATELSCRDYVNGLIDAAKAERLAEEKRLAQIERIRQLLNGGTNE